MTPLASWALLLLAAGVCYLFAAAYYANAHAYREDDQA